MAKTLTALADDTSPEVRARVATNATTPVAIYKRLSVDEDARVRAGIPSAAVVRRDKATLEMLSEDGNGAVKKNALIALFYLKHRHMNLVPGVVRARIRPVRMKDNRTERDACAAKSA